MNRAQRRRFSSRLRAKYALKTYLLPCMLVTLIAYSAEYIGSYAAGGLLPDYSEIINAPDAVSLFPGFARYGLVMMAVSIVLSPLTLGMYWYLSELSMLRRHKTQDVFAWVLEAQKLFGALCAKLLYLAIGARDLVIFAALPAAGVYLVSRSLDVLEPSTASSLMLLCLLLLVVGLILAAVDFLSYKPALYLYAASPEMGVRRAFSECRQFMSHYRLEFAVLHLSMLGWFLAEYLTCGIFMLYTRPYFNLTLLVFTQYAYKLWLIDTGKLDRERFEVVLPGLPEFDSGWLW